MTEELTPEAPLPNGAAHDDLGRIPVMGTEPVKAKRKRKKKAAPKVSRAPKSPRIDPLRAEEEASKASTTTSPDAMVAAPIEEAPTSTLLTEVGAAFVEARARRHESMFADARSTTAPPIKSTWAQRFVFGLRRMTGFDRAEPEPVRLSTTLTIILCFALVGTLAGVARAWL